MTPREIDWPATLVGFAVIAALVVFWVGVARWAPEVVRWFA